jgi:hypothetical protein
MTVGGGGVMSLNPYITISSLSSHVTLLLLSPLFCCNNTEKEAAWSLQLKSWLSISKSWWLLEWKFLYGAMTTTHWPIFVLGWISPRASFTSSISQSLRLYFVTSLCMLGDRVTKRFHGHHFEMELRTWRDWTAKSTRVLSISEEILAWLGNGQVVISGWW